ncbi:calpastatin isoform X3 [Carcharodon carcharias]|uniref:calpastatin isoform X3 n=1 Tax=Carcharodon carcharias TaxID=13397 RepID=UPI001B7DB86F|nr:calpastatin isoform X3 [Carcharodon carcharias]
MSQHNKKKAKGHRKGGKKSDSAKSSKQGASMSAQASEPLEKPGSATSHKSADSSKDKTTSVRSAKSSEATGGKQQQPQTVPSQLAKMGLGWTKTAEVDPKGKSAAAPAASVPGTSVHKATAPKLQGEKPMLSAMEQLMETLPSQEPDPSIPKYTGPEVKESADSKKKAKLVGETEESIPPDYRFTQQADPKDKSKVTPSSTQPEIKPKSMSEGDVLESLSADFGISSSAPISKCSAPTSHSAAPPSVQKQAPLKTSTAASVPASKSDAKDEDPFDLLAGTLPSEAPDNSAPKYTGPEVKESDVTKKKAERVGETEGSIPPDYRFKEQQDPKGKGKVVSSSTGPGAKPKVTEKSMTEGDVLESLSADFTHSSPAPISKCSAPTSHSAAPPSMQKQAPLKASTVAPVSAGKTDTKDEDPFDLLAGTLPSEAPDNSAPKYTGPAVKESDVTKKKAERVGETEGSIPPDYRFKEQPDPKDKGKVTPSSTGPGAKPKVTEQSVTEGDVLESLSADFTQSSSAPISKCSAPTSHSAAPPFVQKEAPLKASTAAPVSVVKSDAKGEDPFDLLVGTLPSEAPDNSAPKYTGPAVKESDVTKKKTERVGETEGSIPPDYRFKDQPDLKDKGKVVSSSTGPGAKPKVTEKSMTEGDVLESLSADFTQSSSAPISKCSAPTSHSAAPPSVQKQAPLKASTAASISASKRDAKDEDPFDLLAGTLPSEAPDKSAPKYTGPAVKESDATKKKAERVGETEGSIPLDYRFKEQPDPKDKGKVASSSTGPGAKPKVTGKSMTEGDVLESLSADFTQSSSAPISKCSAPTSHSAAPPSMQKEAPLKASTAAPVSVGKSDAKDEDPFDLLAGTLPSEAPDNSAPKYTGPAVKESDVTKKKAERVGETEGSIPPNYRFKGQPDPKDKGKVASSSTGPGAKPKGTEKSMTEDDVLESLSADFVQSSPAPISKCSAPTSHSAVPLCMQKEAPLKASTAASVSADKSGTKDEDPFELLAGTLPSEAPDNSAPKYTGPVVKESDVTKKKAERVGETEGSIPPDYRFKEQPDPKDKGKVASSSTGPGAKPKATEKSMTKGDVLESLSADFDISSSVPISKCSAPTSHSAAPPPMQKEAPLKALMVASVSASQIGTKGKDPFDLLAETLPSEAPDDSAPKYTGPEVKESDVTKKKAERVGETEGSIPPDYRFKDQPDPKEKGKVAPSSTGPGAKPKSMSEGDILESLSADFTHSSPALISKCSAETSHSAAPPSKQKEAPLKTLTAASPSASKSDTKSMTEGDVLESLSADFTHSSPAPISKCSAPTSHSAAPPSMQKEAPLKASTAASVTASQSGTKVKDPVTLLAETLPSEAPDKSGPKYTGPVVKEADHSKKKAELVGETEESIPPDYRFTEQADPKDKGKVAPSSTGPGAKPKAPEKILTKADLVESLSSDFDSCSSASHSGAQVSKQKEAGSVSQAASTPQKNSDVGPESPKAKNQPTAKPDAKKARKR